VVGIPKDYDIHFQYHPEKANVVADALSPRSYPTLSSLLALPTDLRKDFKKLELHVVTRETKYILYTMEIQPTLIEEIRAAQSTNPLLDRIRTEVLAGKAPGSVIHEDGMLRF